MKKLILLAVVVALALLIFRGSQDVEEPAVTDSALPAVAALDVDFSAGPLSLILDGKNPVEGDMGVNEYTLRHREVQINPACLDSTLAVQEGDAIRFSPFGDTVIQGKVQHVQVAEDALSFTVVVDGVPETHIDVTIFDGRITIRYDRVDLGRRYLVVRTKSDSQYFALEIDSRTEWAAKREKARQEVELAKEPEKPSVHHCEKHEVVPDAPGGRTMFGGTDFSIDQLPECRFKRDLLALDPEAQAAAIATLSGPNISFHKNDLQDLYVDTEGGVNYACSFLPPEETGETTEPEGDPDIADAPVPVSLPPIRHSNADSTNKLFLDFNGHYIAEGDTVWENTTYSTWSTRPGEAVDSPPWDCKAWSADADRTQFSDSEQAYIIAVWARVAEDYAGFDVDVTTEFPGSWSRNVGHCLFTSTTDALGNDLPHLATGGRAYVNVFGWSSYSYDFSGRAYSPAFVAASDSMSYYYAEAGSHELGHNMGLSHDGDSGATYYSGHAIANGDSHTWNAIMGGGVTPDIGQWSQGEYYDANQSQDDLSIIEGKLGIRSDDHGDTSGTASALTVQPDLVTVSAAGVVETTDDPDVFSFSTDAGEISFDADTYKRASSDWGSSLDILLELRDGTGTLVATNNPATDVLASITATVTKGTYYLTVKPTGVSDPISNPPYGYTSYGSLGFYSISGTVVNTNSITLESPLGGEAWNHDTTQTVQWTSGNSNGMSNVRIFQNGSNVFTIASNVSNAVGNVEWVVANSLSSGTNYSVRVESSTNASIFSESGAISIKPWFPYAEGLETGLGIWEQSADNDFDWSRISGSTPSTDTGPSSAYAGSWYVFTEASSPNYPYKTAGLEADFPFNVLSNPKISFAYHMYGADTGTLALQVSTNGGAAWTTAWSLSGDQGDQWFQTNVTLAAYAGTPVRLRFRGVTGSGYAGDMALDSIAISNAVAQIVTDVSELNVPEGSTNTFQIKLSSEPLASVTVNVARVSGDTNINVSSDASLEFTTGNWGDYQTVVLAADEDDDWASSSAVIRCSSSGLTDLDVTATEVENDTNPALLLPFSETFEDNASNAGTLGLLDGQHAWSATAATVTASYAQSGSQSCLIGEGGYIRHTFEGDHTNVWILMWAQATFTTEPPSVDPDASAVFYFNSSGNVVAYSNDTPVEVVRPTSGSGWQKLLIHLDYVAHTWALQMNDVNVFSDFGFYSNSTAFTELEITESNGGSTVDSIQIALTNPVDTDSDGIPNWWEIQYFGGATNADAGATCSNGVNTVLEAYVAGLNPTNPASVFVMTQLGSDAGDIDRAVLQWNMVSNRLYTIYWTSNLLSGFPPSPLATNITAGAFTDTVHSANDDGFYRIEVDLAP